MDDGRSALHLDDDNPWPGLAAYDEASQHYFHGREHETAELLRLIRLSPFVTLYGKSGLGKSSMLQAGLFPQLRAERFLPVYLRLDFGEHAEMPPLAQAALRLRQEIDVAGADAPPLAEGESLWAYLQRRERPIWTKDNYPLTPVLVFDQFEEVFSRGGSVAHVKEVLDDMADLVGDRLSSDLAEDREGAKRLNLQSQQYRVLLSFRSDFLAEVENWEKHANLPKRESLHLTAMTRDAAVEAIEQAGAAVLAPGVASQIVDFLLTRDDAVAPGRVAEVEPVLMSLCCFQLNNRRQRPARIDSALLRDVGDNILQGFYVESLAGMPASVSTFIEDNLIQGRYRSSFPRDAALDSGALTRDQLKALTDRHLLRIDPQGEVPRIELIHDRLVTVVREARDVRLAREQVERDRLAAEARAQRERDDQQREHEEAAQRARVERERERAVAAERERKRVARWRNGLVVALVLLAAATLKLFNTADRAKESSRRAQALRLVFESQAILGGAVAGTDTRAYQQLLVARALEPLPEVEGGMLDALMARQHLRRFAPVEVGNASGVRVVVFSPDRKLFALGHDDGSVSLRAIAEPMKELGRGGGGGKPVRSLAFGADGSRLVTGTEDGLLQRWRVAAAALTAVGEPVRLGAPILGVAYSPDGRRLVSGSEDGAVRLWDAEAGDTPIAVRDLAPQPVRGIAFSPNPAGVDAAGHIAIAVAVGLPASAPATGAPRRTNLVLLDEALQPVGPGTVFAHSDAMSSIAFSPDGMKVLSGGFDDVLRVRDLGPDQSSARMGGHRGDVLSVAFSPDGQSVASGGRDSTVRLWRVAGGEPLGLPLRGHDDVAVTGVAFSPPTDSGRWLASADERGRLRLWAVEAVSPPLTGNRAAERSPADPSRVQSVALSPDGTLIALGRGDGSVLLQTVGGGAPERVFVLPPPATGAVLAPCKPRPVAPAGSAAGAAEPAPPTAVTSLAFVGDGKTLLAGQGDGRLQRLDVATGGPAGAPLHIADCALTALAGSADGRRLAVAADGRALLVDPRLGTLQDSLELGHGAVVIALALSADGRWLASSGTDTRLLIRDTGDREAKARSFDGLLGDAHSLAFSPDGVFLVSGTARGNLRFWDRRSQRPLGRPLEAHGGRTAAIAFAPDGQSFVSAGGGGMVRRWTAPAAWPTQMCAKLVANVSRRDWTEMVSRENKYTCQCPDLPIAPDDPTSTSTPERCAAAR